MRRYIIQPITLLTALLCFTLHLVAAEPSRRPNVVLILTDNQAAWTLGCYGNPDIRTPNIDRLAAGGMQFNRCYSVNAVCSPTRATLLTGLIPSQHGVHCYLGGGYAQTGPDPYNMIEEFHSLPEILAESGWVCGMAGKWHLGDNARPQEGFSHWITMPHGHTTAFYDAAVIENGKTRKEPTYLTKLWTDHAVEFIEENKERPFFLYLPYNGPYGLGQSLNKPARNRHAEYYADKLLPSFPRNPMHPWLRNNRQFLNNIGAMRRYAAEISGVDDGVGRVMETLQRLGLEKDTIVIFTADQGLCCGQHGMWAMGDHTRPLHTFDDGIHIPLLWYAPGRITSGKNDRLVSIYDLMPTLLSCLGLGDKMATEPPSPGRDYSPMLRGESPEWDDVIYYESENSRMIRTADWKYTKRVPDGPNELYHVAKDPGEYVNLAADPAAAIEKDRLTAQLNAFFEKYANPKYDLWKDGKSKTLLITYPKDRQRVRP